MKNTQEDNVASLYETLKREKLKVPSLEQFRQDMKDRGKLTRVREKLIELDYTPPEEKDFFEDMGYHDSPDMPFAMRGPVNETAPAARALQPSRIGVDYDKPADAWKGVMPLSEEAEALMERTAPKKQDVKGHPDGVSATPLTERDKAVGLANVAAMQNQVQAGADRTLQRIDDMTAYGKGMNFGHTQQGATKYDALQGKYVTNYLTPMGESHENKMAADLESAAYRRAVEEANKPTLQKYREKLPVIDAEIERLEAEMAERRKKGGERTVVSPTTGLATVVHTDKDLDALEASVNQLHELRNKIVAATEDGGVGQAFKDVFTDPDVLTLGLTDMQDAGTMLRIMNKVKQGAALTDAEKGLMEHYQNNLIGQNALDEYVNNSYNFGNIAFRSVPFMAEIMLANPMTSGIQFGSKKAASYLAEKGLEKGFKKTAVKALGATADDLAAAALVSNTTMLPGTLADYAKNRAGQATVTPLRNGQPLYTFKDGMGILESAYRAEAGNTIENYTELLGEHFGPAGQWIGQKLSGSRIPFVKGITDAFKKVSSTDAYQFINKGLEKAGFHGFVPEVLEEEAGIPLSYVFLGEGPSTWDEATRQQVDILGGIGLSCGMLSALRLSAVGAVEGGQKGIQAVGYVKAKRQLHKADQAGAYGMTEARWVPIREALDAAPHEEFEDTANEILSDPELSGKDRKYIIDYARKLNFYRGYNMGTVKVQQEGGVDTDEQAANEAYMSGYQMSTPEEKRDAANLLEYQRIRLAEKLGVSPDILDEEMADPIDFVRNKRALGSSEAELQSIIDYANARLRVEAMQQRAADDLDSQIALSNQMVDSQINQQDGKVHPAMMKSQENPDGRAVYIVDGDVVLTDDGTMVDTQASSSSLLVKDVETGEISFAAPGDFLSVGEAADGATAKEEAEQRIRDTFTQQYEAEVQGVITSWSAGDRYVLTSQDGQTAEVTLAANEQGLVDNGDGTVNVVVNGNELEVMSKSVIQEGYDLTNRERVAQQAEADAQTHAAASAASAEDVVPTYQPGDTFVLRDDDRKEKQARIVGRMLYDKSTGQLVPAADGPIIAYEVVGEPEPRYGYENELGAMIQSYQSAAPVQNDMEGVASEQPATEATPAPAEAAVSKGAKVDMPKDRFGNVDYYSVPPLQTLQYIQHELGSESEVAAYIERQLKRANAALKKAETPPNIETNIAHYNQVKEQRKQDKKAIEKVIAYWQQVSDLFTAKPKAAVAEPVTDTRERDKDGNLVYEKLSPEETLADVYQYFDMPEVAEFLGEKLKDAQTALDAALTEKPKAKITNVVKYRAEKEAIKAKQDAAQSNLDYWKSVQAMHADNINANASGQSVDEEIDYEPQNAAEYVASQLGTTVKITPESFKRETGLGNAEQVKLVGVIASESNGGVSIERAAEIIASNGELVQFGISDDTEVRNLIIDVLSQGNPRGYIKRAREAELQALAEQEAAELEDFAQTHFHLSGEDYLAYEETRVPELIVQYQGFDEEVFLSEINDLINERNDNRENDAAAEGAEAGGSHQVLQGEQPSYVEGFGGVEERNGEGESDAGYEVPGANGTEGKEVISSEERSIMESRIIEWLSEENLSRAAGKTRSQIIEEFGNELEPIAYIPARFISLIHPGVTDTRIYCGKGYFIDHVLRNHGGAGSQIDIDDVDVSKYLNIQNVLDNPDHIKETFVDGKRTVVFIKKMGRYYAELTQTEENGKIVLHKSFYNQKKEPYAKLNDIRDKNVSPEGGASSISHADKTSAPAISLESRDDISFDKDKNVTDNKQETSAKKVENSISAAEGEVNTAPTEAQKKAGNYKMGHVKVDGYDITIENPKGSTRSGKDADGKEWSVTMNNTYGYIRGTEGVDGDHIDIFLSDTPEEGEVYVVDQVREDGSFDEHKVMYGFTSEAEAKAAYLSNYSPGWKGLGQITNVSKSVFRKWIESSHRKTKPFAAYKGFGSDNNVGTKNGKTNTDKPELPSPVNKNGYISIAASEPIVLYHGTENGNLMSATQLEPGHKRVDGEKAIFNGNGISFTPDRSAAADYAGKDGKVLEAKVKLNKPYISYGNSNMTEEEAVAFSDKLKEQGYDGIVVYASHEMREIGALPMEVIAFDKSSIEDVEQDRPGRGVSDGEKPEFHKGRDVQSAQTQAQQMATDAVLTALEEAGVPVKAVSEEELKALDGKVQLSKKQKKMLSSLSAAANAIKGWLTEGKRGKSFTFNLPNRTLEMIRKVAGRDFNSHRITANGIVHSLKNHGVGGVKLNKKSIALRESDVELVPYIMTAPDWVEKGSVDVSGRESIKFYKRLSNGYVVVVEKEYKNSPDDMETITMWAERSSEATNAQSTTVPDTHVQNAILSTDIAKIKKDAESAIIEDIKKSKSVFHSLITSDGTIYGAAYNGTVYLNRDALNPETPLHEYTHLWAKAMMQHNPEGWLSVKELLKDTPVWDEVVNDTFYADIQHDEDAVASEVLSRISGKQNAARMEAEAQKMIDEAEGALAKAEAITLLQRMKDAVNKFWNWVGKDLFGIKKFDSIDEVTDRVLYDLLHGTKLNVKSDGKMEFHIIGEDIRQNGKKIADKNWVLTAYNKDEPATTLAPADSDKGSTAVASGSSVGKVTKNDGTLAEKSVKTAERKSLVGVHNISEEKLRKALKLGGLANPSIAVINSENQKHEDYGDISLVLPSHVLNGEKTYSGDAWSPTYPKIIRQLSSKDYTKLAKRVRKSVENYPLANSILGNYEQFLEGEVQTGLEYLFLKENGYQPKDITSGGMDISRQYFLDKFGIKDDGFEDFQKAMEAPDEVWIEFNKWRYANGKQSIYDYRTRKINDNLSKFGDTEERKAFIMEPYLVKEFSSFNSFMNQMRKSELHKDDIDVRATLDNAKNEVVERMLGSEFDKWLEEFIEESGAEEVFFDGYTPNGNRRYKKATLENISKKMKSEGKLNAYNDTGLGATRSLILKKMTSLDEIKSKKGLLQTDEVYKEKYEHLKDELINLSGELAERQTVSDNAFYAIDAANRRIQEALVKKNPVSYLNKEYGYEIDKKSDLAKRLNHFKEDLVTMPSKYFETKFERPVKLNEFSAAVVPSTTSNDIKQALRDNGLHVVEYKADDKDSREAAFDEAIHADDDVLFREAEDTPTLSSYPSQFSDDKLKVSNLSPDTEVEIVEYKGEEDVALDDAIAALPESIPAKQTPSGVGEVRISKKSRLKLKNQVGKISEDLRKPYIKTIKDLESVIEKSLLVEEHRDREKSEDGNRHPENVSDRNIYKVQRLYGAIRIDGDNYRVKTTIRVFTNHSGQRLHGYDITKIELLAPQSYTQNEKSGSKTTTNNSITLAKLLKGVELSYEPSVKLLEAMAKVSADRSMQREGNGPVSDDRMSFENDPVAKMLGEPRGTRKSRALFAKRERERMMKQAKDLCNKLHLDNVEFVTSDELEGRKAKAKGFFNRRTGKITIVVDNHVSSTDMQETILHEAVGHYGLRQLFGKHFDTFLDNVLQNAAPEVYQRIVEMAKKHNWDFNKATEEYLAQLAEDTEFENLNASWWAKIKRLFLDMLHSIGFEGFSGVSLTDNELRYLLWRSYMNLSEPGSMKSILGVAEDVVKQNALQVGNFSAESDAEKAAAWEWRNELVQAQDEHPGKNADELDHIVVSLYQKWGAADGIPNEAVRSRGRELFMNVADSKVYEAAWKAAQQGLAEPSTTYYHTGEEDAILAKAKADGTYMKAPNGKPTNLNERQWVQVRTENFKNWFGDWEKAARVEKLRKSEPVIASGDEYRGKYELDKPSAFDWIRTHLRKEYTIDDTGETISLEGRGAKKVLSHGMTDEVHLKSIALIPDFIKHAIFIEERPNEKGNDKFDSYRYYVCGLKMDGVDYTVKMVVGVKQGKKYYDHALTEIEKGKLLDVISQSGFTTMENASLPSSAVLKDTKLVSILQTNASKVVDENGEPKVVYHGTPNDFSVFSRDMIGSSTDDGMFGRGFYFSHTKEEAETYKKRKGVEGDVMGVFLNLRNPYVISSKEDVEAYDKLYEKYVTDDVFDAEDVEQAVSDARERGTRDIMALGYDGVLSPYKDINHTVVFHPNQIKSATDNNGEFSTEDDDIYFRSGEEKSEGQPTNGTAFDRYNKAVRTPNEGGTVKQSDNLGYRLREAYQDSMLALHKLQDAIAKESGDIEDFENAYMAENRMASTNNPEKELYERDYMNPLIAAVGELTKDGKTTYDEVNSYLMAKHGLERNEYFRKKKATEAAERWASRTLAAEAEKGTSEEDARDIVAEGQKKVYDKAYEKLADEDFSGLSELTAKKGEGEGDNKEFTQRAEELVSAFEDNHPSQAVSALWDKIHAATDASLKKAYDSGNLSLEMYEYIKGMFEYYVPLRGWESNEAGKEYNYMLEPSLKSSPAVARMKGRHSKADDVIAYIGFTGESTIIRGNRNKMKQHLLYLALNHPSSLISVSEQWYVKDDVNGDWVERYPQIPDEATPEEADEALAEFEKRMEELKAQGKAKKGKNHLDTGMHIKRSEEPEHLVKVMRRGEVVNLYINGNPRAAQAVNGLLNPDNHLTRGIFPYLTRVKHFMARNFTSNNPAFIFSNFFRDAIWAGVATHVKENAEYRKKSRSNIFRVLTRFKTFRLLYKFNHEKLNDNDEIERYFKEFLMNGGETGFTSINSVEDYKRNMKRAIQQIQNPNSPLNVSKKAWNWVWGGIEFMNRSVEDISRFTVYMTSRQCGRSIERSIWDAKEITVNFNKKGSGAMGAAWVNFAYVFFNAAIQSVANITKLIVNHPGKMGLATGAFAALGMLVPAYSIFVSALMGDDDDEDAYFDLPQWVRENNLVLYVPCFDRKFITIPLPHELRPFYAMGEHALCVMMGKEEVDEALRSAVLSFSSMLPLDMSGHGDKLWLNFVPTAALPIAENAANVDFFGKPIYKHTPFNDLDPEYQRVYRGTSPLLVEFSQWTNQKTLGDDVQAGFFDWNPAKLEHVLSGYFGGMGKTIIQTANFVSSFWNEDARMMRNVPVFSSFIKDSDPRFAGSALSQSYFDHKEELRQLDHDLRGYEKLMGQAWADKDTVSFAKYRKIYNDYKDKHLERRNLLDSYIYRIEDLKKRKQLADKTEQEKLDVDIQQLQRELEHQVEAME